MLSFLVNNNIHLSKAIDFLRFPLAVLVIYIHLPENASGIGKLTDLSLNDLNLGTLSLYVKLLIESWFAPIAVPLFFFFSGLFIYNNVKSISRRLYFNKLKTRFYTIVIPFFSWAILYYIILSFYKQEHYSEWWHALTNIDYYKGIFYSSESSHIICRQGWFGTETYLIFPQMVFLWFLRDLYILIILSPIIYFLAKYVPVLSFLVLSFCFITATWFPFIGFDIGGIYFFFLGVVLSQKGCGLLDRIERYTVHIAILAFALLVYSSAIVFDGATFKGTTFSVLANSILTLLIVYRLSKMGYLKTYPILAQSSMFIYCWHGLPLLGGISIFYWLFDKFNIDSLVAFYCAPILIALTGTCIYYLLQRFLPVMNKVLAGK